MIDLNSNAFPSADNIKSYRLLPIVLHPIFDSPERLVIAVLAYSGTELHLTQANALTKLECLYGENASATITVIELALTELISDLAAGAEGFVARPEFLFSGIEFGKEVSAEGFSAKHVADFHMSLLSSLHRHQLPEVSDRAPMVAAGSEARQQRSDRLPFLVHEYVKNIRPEFTAYFSTEIQSNRVRRSKSVASQVHIDFAGSNTVANFGTLKVGQATASFDHLKRRLWDLKIHRDTKEPKKFVRNHELYVQYPPKNSPQISNDEFDQLSDAIGSITEEADVEEIRLRSFHTVEEIGGMLLKLETGPGQLSI